MSTADIRPFHPPPSDSAPQKNWVLVVLVLVLVEVAGIFEHSMVLGAIPYFAELFSVDIAAATWMITLFMLTGAGSAIFAGKLGDMYGRKKVVIVLLAISLVGSAVAIVFADLPALLIGRALQGTSAGILPLLIGIAREVAPEEKVPVIISVMSAIGVATGGLGVLVAGLFIDAGQWRMIFVTAAVLCAVVLAATWCTVPGHQVLTRTRIDWVGALLLAPASITLLYGLSAAADEGFIGPVVTPCIVAGVAMLVFWVWWEMRTVDPLVDIRLVISPVTGKAVLAAVLAGLGPIGAYTVYSPLIALSPTTYPIGLGMTSTAFGAVATVGALITLLVSPLAGVIARKRGAAFALIVGLVLIVIHAGGLMIPILNGSIAAYVVLSIFATVATSFILASIYNLIVDAVPAENTSEYISIIQVIRSATIAVGTVVVSAVVSSSVVAGTTAPTASAWNLAMVYVIVLAVAAGVVALVINVQHKARSRGDGLMESAPVA